MSFLFQMHTWVFVVSSSAVIITLGGYFGGMHNEPFLLPLMGLGILLWLNIILVITCRLKLKRPLGDGIDLGVLLFVAYASWSCLFYSEAKYAARTEFIWILNYAAFFFNARYALKDRNYFLPVLVIIILVSLANVAFGFMHLGHHSYLIWDHLRPEQYQERMSGFFGCPNHFGNFCAMAYLGALIIGLNKRIPWLIRILFLYFAVMATVGIVFSGSRGSYLAWFFGTIVLAALLFNRVRIPAWAKITVLASLGIVVFFFVTSNELFMKRISRAHFKDIRVTLIEDGLKIWKTEPYLGTGAAEFDFQHQRIRGPKYQSRAKYTHNDYINTLSDYGMVGLILISAFVSVVLWTLLKTIKSRRSSEGQLYAKLGIALLFLMGVHELVDFNLHIPVNAISFFCLLGFCLVKGKEKTSDFTKLGYGMSSLILLVSVVSSAMIIKMVSSRFQGLQGYPKAEETLLLMPPEDVEALGDSILNADPYAYKRLEGVGDYFRFKASQTNKKIRLTQKQPIEVRSIFVPALEKERDELGDKALKFYNYAHKANTLDDRFIVKKARIYTVLGKYDKAEPLYQTALKLRKTNRYFYRLYALHLVKSGNLKKAKTILKKSLGFPPPQIHLDEAERTEIDLIKKMLGELNRISKAER